MFLGSKKNPCYFCAFNFAGFSGPFLAFSLYKSRIFLNWLFLQLLWYLQVIVSQNFLVNHFLCKNCEKNLLANFCSQDRPWTYLNSYETLLILLEIINCLTFFKKDARSFKTEKWRLAGVMNEWSQTGANIFWLVCFSLSITKHLPPKMIGIQLYLLVNKN